MNQSVVAVGSQRRDWELVVMTPGISVALGVDYRFDYVDLQEDVMDYGVCCGVGQVTRALLGTGSLCGMDIQG